LLGEGLHASDRVGVLSVNRLEYLTSFFGTMRAGLVCVPISIKLPRETIDYIVRDAGLAAVVHDAERADFCPEGVPRIGLDDGAYASLLDPGPFATVEPVGRALAMMLYTSGSTGRPKGVLLSHASQLWGLNTAENFYKDSEDLAQHRYLVAA